VFNPRISPVVNIVESNQKRPPKHRVPNPIGPKCSNWPATCHALSMTALRPAPQFAAQFPVLHGILSGLLISLNTSHSAIGNGQPHSLEPECMLDSAHACLHKLTKKERDSVPEHENQGKQIHRVHKRNRETVGNREFLKKRGQKISASGIASRYRRQPLIYQRKRAFTEPQ
jgi:hypothetical protein